MRWQTEACVVVLVGLVVPLASLGTPHPSDESGLPATPADIRDGYFTENTGQLRNEDVRYYASWGALAVGFGRRSLTFVLVDSEARPSSRDQLHPVVVTPPTAGRVAVVRMTFEGARPVDPQGIDEMAFSSHFFLGNEPSRWRTGVRSYREVVYDDLYDGIDLVYRATVTGVKYEFRLDAGADPASIVATLRGIEALRADSGGLIVRTIAGEIRDTPPVAAQGGAAVDCRFALRGPWSYGFDCAGWDASREGVIDPLMYATFVGGGGYDQIDALALDAAGNVYVAGSTDSFDFPATPGAHSNRMAGIGDAFVASFDPGGALRFATYLGGWTEETGDAATGIDLGPTGEIYVAGYSNATDFPVTFDAFDPTYNDVSPCAFIGCWDGFFARLNPTGSALLYATYLGGRSQDLAESVRADAAGNAYLAGHTVSDDFPTTAGAYDRTPNGSYDAWVSSFSLTGALRFSTRLGGFAYEWWVSLDLGPDGSVYVTGETASSNYPTTAGAFDTAYGGSGDVFVARFTPDLSGLIFSTFLGGTGADRTASLAVDASGDVLVAGQTASTDFPVTPGALDTTMDGGWDAFVARLSGDGTSVAWATFLGGSGLDTPRAITVDANGTVSLAGVTSSTDFPVTPDAFDTTPNGGQDAFVTRLNARGAALVNSSYLGGSGADGAWALEVRENGDVFVAGTTSSPDFPVTSGAFDTILGGSSDGFLAMPFVGAPDLTVSPPDIVLDPPGPVNVGDIVAINATVRNLGTADATNVRVRFFDGPPPGANQIGGDQFLPRVAASGSGEVSVSWSAGPPGAHDLCVVADPEDEIGESNEGNNEACVPLVVMAPDEPPVAVAQASPALARIGDPIQFDGSGSTDDVGIVAYAWDFGDANVGAGAVVVHAYASRGTFVATLTVRDTANQSDSDAVTILIENSPPIADAGPDQTVPKRTPVTLDGSRSSDADGDPLAYAWTQTGGPAVTLGGADTATPGFTPTIAGLYAFRLEVQDGWGGAADDTVTVTAVNQAPLASAGADRTVPKKTVTVLDGSGSADPDGDPLAYAWWQVGGPPVGLVGSDTATPSFTPPSGGVYVFQLMVDDGDGGSGMDSVEVTATNAAPVADAGPDGLARKGTPVLLDGTGSSDGDGDALSFSWTQVSGPPVTLADAGTPSPSFAPSRSGTHVFRLDVSDPDGGEGWDEVSILVWGLAPVAVLAVNPAEGLVGEALAFDGSGSYDPDGVIVAYTFAFGDGSDAGGAAALEHAFAAPGNYTISLTVMDEDGNTSVAFVSVTIHAPLVEPRMEANWKPIVAAVFAALLFVAGAASARARPWRGGESRGAVLRAFVVTSLPFVVAEMVTGVVSLATGTLSIPPLLGWGTLVDSLILASGLAVAGLRTRGNEPPEAREGDAR